jgi:hypothetical protein
MSAAVGHCCEGHILSERHRTRFIHSTEVSYMYPPCSSIYFFEEVEVERGEYKYQGLREQGHDFGVWS